MAPERSLVGEGLKPLDPEEISHKLLLAGLEIEKVSAIDIYKVLIIFISMEASE